MAERKQPVAAAVGVGPGLGAALARRFASGYAVALVARRVVKLKQLAAELNAARGRPLAVAAVVSKPADIAAALTCIRRELGEVAVLLYNAAMRRFGRLLETKPSTFENTRRVNGFGAFLFAQAVVPAMLARGNGVICHLAQQERSAWTQEIDLRPFTEKF